MKIPAFITDGPNMGVIYVDIDPEPEAQDVEIDLTEFAEEVEEINVPRTLTPRIDEIQLSYLRAQSRKA